VTKTLAVCGFVVVDVDEVVLDDEPQLAPNRQRPTVSAIPRNLFMANSVPNKFGFDAPEGARFLTREYENTWIGRMSRNPSSGYGMHSRSGTLAMCVDFRGLHLVANGNADAHVP
jgi:hypothetical protein